MFSAATVENVSPLQGVRIVHCSMIADKENLSVALPTCSERTTVYESQTWRRRQRPQPASRGGRGRCLATTPIGRRGAVTSPGADLTVPTDAYGARRPLDSTDEW